MFKENLQILCKQKGMSQETLAQQLNVVRQTISKWEKGLSVPDADMLIRIADVFDTSVSELLGVRIEQEENINEIATQLALLNEQLAHEVGIHKRVFQLLLPSFLFVFLPPYIRDGMSFGGTSGVTYIIFLISDGVTAIKGPGVRTGTTFNLSMCEAKEMILFIQCVVCCLLLTLAILPAQYKDPINYDYVLSA